MKILNTQPIPEDVIEQIEALGYTMVDYKKNHVDEELTKDIDILFGHDPFRFLPLEAFPNLKFLQMGSAGINHVPLDELAKRNILLANNRGTFSIPIAEFIVMRILEILKDARGMEEMNKKHIWEKRWDLQELTNQVVGFIGTGSIATEAAKRLRPFGCKILGYSRRGRQEADYDQCYKMEDAKDTIAQCDFIVITAPHTDETHHMVNEALLAAMKPGVSIVNIARGTIIDEKALIEALRSGQVGHAALDVFEVEPLPEDSPLWSMANVSVSAHSSFSSPVNYTRTMKILLENLKRYRDGEPLVNAIDIKQGY